MCSLISVGIKTVHMDMGLHEPWCFIYIGLQSMDSKTAASQKTSLTPLDLHSSRPFWCEIPAHPGLPYLPALPYPTIVHHITLILCTIHLLIPVILLLITKYILHMPQFH